MYMARTLIVLDDNINRVVTMHGNQSIVLLDDIMSVINAYDTND